MRTLTLVTLLALATLCLCRKDSHSTSADESPSSEAFMSRRDSAVLMRRQKRNYVFDSGYYGVVRDPLEGKREVCELNPACDELADHIGFHEAYQRFYGPI